MLKYVSGVQVHFLIFGLILWWRIFDIMRLKIRSSGSFRINGPVWRLWFFACESFIIFVVIIGEFFLSFFY